MKVSVLADDDGEIIALAMCSMSPTGVPGSFTYDADIRAEISRSALDARRGRPSSADVAGDDLITSVTLELSEEFQHMSLGEIREKMALYHDGPVPRLARKAAPS